MIRRAAILICAAALGFSGVQADGQEAGSAAPAAETTVLLSGDLLGPYGTAFDASDPELAPLRNLLGSADAAFANQEGSSFDLGTFDGSIAAENGGGYPLHTLPTMRELRTFGFNLLSRANNHSTDWGAEGLLASDSALTAIGFVHAGTGRSLTDARKPSVLATRAGNVALVATASTFPGMSPAGDSARGAGPRPGLSPLRVEPVTLVRRGEMQALRSIVVRGGYQGYDPPAARPVELRLNEKLYRVSDRPGLTYVVSKPDRDALLSAVEAGRSQAAQVIFSIHAHETLSGAYEDPNPADFLPSLFHDAIDRGATMVVRHGPHAVQGIEIYKGKPIFYGLGHFFFELPRSLTIASEGPSKQTVSFPPTWWEGATATVRFAGGQLREIRIYPLALQDDGGPRHGLPSLATGKKARAILERIRVRSAAFGTTVRIVGDIGIIDGFTPQ